MSETAAPTHEAAPASPGISARAARRVALVMGAWMLVGWGLVALFWWGATPGGWWTFAFVALVSTAPVAVVIQGLRGTIYPVAWQRLFVLRPFVYVLLLLPLVALAGLAGGLISAPFGAFTEGGRWASGAVAAVIGLVCVAGYVGSRRLVVKHVEVRAEDLPQAFDGLRIAHLSDLHVGPHTRRRFLARIARCVEEAHPDIIAHTGDQVDDYDIDVAHFVAAFGHLRAPLGTFAIAGNHDIYAGWDGVRDGLTSAGVRVLVNEAVPIERAGERIWLAGTGDPAASQWGVNDPTAPAPDLDRTMAAIPRDGYSIVLAHNPALWPGLAARGARLTLSGHTHHGQISIPALRWCLASPFLEHAMGRYDQGRSVLYINPGTNHWGLPLRLGAWPEVTIVTLRRRAP